MTLAIVCMSILSIHRNRYVTRMHSSYAIGTLPNPYRLIFLAELFQLSTSQLIDIFANQFLFDQNFLLKRFTVP